MEHTAIRRTLTKSAVALTMVAAGIATAPARAHHNTCTWGVDVEVSAAANDPLVSYGPPLAMWGCHGPVVWVTVVDANGNKTFVPVYGSGPSRPL